MIRRPFAVLALAIGALATTACAPPAPPEPSPLPSQPADATVVDCAETPSPFVDDDGVAVAGACDEVTVHASDVWIEQAAAVTITEGTGIVVLVAERLTINAADVDVTAGVLGDVELRGTDHVVTADEITGSLVLRGAGSSVTWFAGIAQDAAETHGLEHELLGPAADE